METREVVALAPLVATLLGAPIYAVIRGGRDAQRELARMRGLILSVQVAFQLARFGLWIAMPLPLFVIVADLYWAIGTTVFEKRLKRGDYVLALAAADRRLRLSPADPGYLHLRGRALLLLGRHQEAEVALKAALAETDMWFDAWKILRDLETATTNLGNSEEAARVQKTLAALGAEIPAQA